MSTTCSSASSTASTKGSSSDERSLNKSRQNPNQGVNGARGGPKNNWTTEMDTPPTGGPPPMTALPSVGLRDTKIEIAGKIELLYTTTTLGTSTLLTGGRFTEVALCNVN